MSVEKGEDDIVIDTSTTPRVLRDIFVHYSPFIESNPCIDWLF